MREELQKLKTELETLRSAYIEKVEVGLKQELAGLFDKYPKLESFSVRVNNHEFNDGDATHFSVYYEEPDLNEVDYDDLCDDEEKGREEAGLTADEVTEITDEINDIFSTFEDELETFYGDAYESLTFNRDDA